MADFIDVAETLLGATCSLPEDKAAIEIVMEATDKLKGCLSKGHITLDNIESVYGAFELARLCGRCGDLAPDKVEELPTAMARVISRTLELAIKYPASEGRLMPTPVHDGLVSAIAKGVRQNGFQDVCFLTFNYDLCLEHALLWNNVPYSYGLEGDMPPNQIPLLKLHGSLNWEDTPQGPVPFDLLNIINGSMLPATIENVTVPYSVLIDGARRSSKHEQFRAFIVPPTYNKGFYHRQIRQVWKNAAACLATADDITFVGFSLPETDQFFQYLFAVGSMGKTRIRRIRVFHFDDPERIRARYDKVLSSQLSPRTSYIKKRFEDSVGDVLDGLV